MTETQLSEFRRCFEHVSRRVSKRLFAFGDIKSPADFKDFIGFSYAQLAKCSGYSRPHLCLIGTQGRKVSPQLLESLQSMGREAVAVLLGAGWDVVFPDRRHPLAGKIVRYCAVCGRQFPAYSRATGNLCQYHRSR